MKVLVVRHAIAMDRAEFKEEQSKNTKPAGDGSRPLTLEGIKKMRKVAKALRKLVDRPELIISSPLTRAQQTGDLLLTVWPDLQMLTADELKPETHPDKLTAWFHNRPDLADSETTVVIIGHEPQLSHFISWFVAGANNPVATLKKGGAALLEFDGLPGRGRGKIAWLVTPGLLTKK